LKRIGWKEYIDLLEQLHNKIRFRQFDSIVSIGRGGCLLASYLASKLGIPLIHTVFIGHRVKHDKTVEIIAHDMGGIETLTGSVLVVDDWMEKGRVMNYTLKHIPREARVTTLVMFCKTDSECKPDIFGKYVEDDAILFPYDP
jgi:hypoxanthine phosphoribosyltransferase